ncbi:hypothetical protein G9A89_015636 [Geosiphon pyriformis]|nr:hypothetical protein G9A89_015636 [Geosiphon pyriformis]
MVDIKINLDKTETMVVRPSKKRSSMVEPLKFGPDKQILKLLDSSTCTQYLGVWIRADGKNETVLKMIGSDIEAVCAVIRKKHITEKQAIYIFNSVLSPVIEFRSQLTHIPNSWARKCTLKISATVKKKAKLSVDFPASAMYHSSLYNLFKINDIQAKSQITDLLVRLNSADIVRMATKIRLANLQAQRWSAYSILEYPTNERSKPGVNLIANIIQMMEKRGISFKSNGNTHGVPESSRPQTYLIESILPSSETYIKKCVQEKLRLRKKIEISTDGSLVRAGSEEAKGAAAFITHGIEAEFGIAIDGTLSLTKAEAKAVLLALEANAIRVIIREKKIDLNMNKVAAYAGILENEKADKLAKGSITLDTVRWAYNAKETAYIFVCGGVELDLNIRHFLNKQASLQSALDWIGNNKIWNWDRKMSSGFISAGSSAMHTFIMKSFHNMLPIAEVLYNRCLHVYLNNLCKTCYREVKTNWHFWECSLNTQKGKTLIDDCLSEAVKGGCEAHNTDEKIVLSNEYIMSMSNIDLLCKGLINKQFRRINAFSDINLRISNNVLIKVCKWAVTQARNRLWGEHCKLQTEWEKTMGIDNRVKRNPTGGSSIHSTSRNSGKDNGKPIVKIGDVFTQCNGILTNVFCGKNTLCNSVIPHRFFGYTSM